jgi:hypothetical protein
MACLMELWQYIQSTNITTTANTRKTVIRMYRGRRSLGSSASMEVHANCGVNLAARELGYDEVLVQIWNEGWVSSPDER